MPAVGPDAQVHGMPLVNLRSLSPAHGGDLPLAAALEPHPMQLEGAFAAAAADMQAVDEERQELCVMRPVVNLPFSGRTPESIARLAAVKPTQLRQSHAVTPVEAAAQRSVLRGSRVGQATISLAELSGMAASADGAAKWESSLLEILCAELDDPLTPADGDADRDAGAPCKMSPNVQGVLPLSHRPYLMPTLRSFSKLLDKGGGKGASIAQGHQ